MPTEDRLNILWTNADPVTSEHMVFMYAVNAMRMGWWEAVTLIVWGRPVELIMADKKFQTLVSTAMAEGVHVSACRRCAEKLGAVEGLEALGMEVIYWGDPLTAILKKDEKLLTV